MDAYRFLDILEELGDAFFAGVPDSLLCPFIDAVMDRHGVSDRHIVAVNEGAAVGLAAGHYLATTRAGIVYMQNSGIGNATNPICSLLHKKVYSIPVIFVIGWRGEPGVKDEPQHIFQGEATLPLLDCLEIPYFLLSKETDELTATVELFKQHINNGKSVAFVIRKDALQNDRKQKYTSDAKLSREEALETILSATRDNEDAVYVCTTGKLSREVFELRKIQGMGHVSDFLSVGSMGHSLMIAHGITLARPERRVYCLDGDGAVLMHMGSLAIVGVHSPENLVHIVINNGAHETVGGLPTAASKLNLYETALALGYKKALQVDTQRDLEVVMDSIKEIKGPVFVEVICNLFSRDDLGRPTTTPVQNRNKLMANLAEKKKMNNNIWGGNHGITR
jgi:phosphonopyruvate decarboxylase